MKNKKKKIGFTLIELLAVIIVLAIIALIATPIIFNVIENAKLKSLENSCYGVIDAVRTKYAEGLLNSIDGTVKLKGNVTEITVSGEQPIAGTWEIDNSSDSDNRGIKIKDVKFGSMKDYTCTNVNSDGTINSKVTCTKGGDSSNDDNDEDILYNVKLLKSYDINYDKCMENYDDEDFCSVPEEFFNKFSHSARIFFDEDLRNELIDNGTIENVQYKQAQLSCFGKELINLKYDVDQDKCVPLASLMIGGEEANTEYVQEAAKKLCNGEIIMGNSTDYFVTNVPYFLEYIGLISNVSYDQEKENTIGNYRCYEGNMYGMPVISDVKIPSNIEEIGETAFSNMSITSVDFSKATNLRKIGHSAFYSDSLTSLDLTNQKKLETIEEQAFLLNQISGNLDLSNLNKLIKIGDRAFSNNQITNVDLNNSSNLITIGDSSFSHNQIATVNFKGLSKLKTIGNYSFWLNQIVGGLDLSDMKDLETIGERAFYESHISSLNLRNLSNLKTISKEAFAYNNITGELDLSDLVNLITIDEAAFNHNKITGKIDLTSSTKLTKIEDYAFNENEISSINLTNLTNLTSLSGFSNNKISDIDLSTLTNLTSLSGFAGNQISNVDLSKLTNLTYLSGFEYNKLTNIDLSKLTNLIYISGFGNNKLTTIDLGNLSNLTTIGNWAFDKNQISGSLDLSALKKLETIGEYAFLNNQLTSIKIPNGVMTIGDSAFEFNSITSIEIDNIKNSISGSPWGADNATITWKRS